RPKKNSGSTTSETKSRAIAPKAPKFRDAVSLESKLRVQASLETLTQLKLGEQIVSEEPKAKKKSSHSQQQDTGARPKSNLNQNQNGQNEGAQ
ncbi:MAG: hypothetical protein AB2693_33940, partial [Candidatus Thiodiazotropha sp.]